VLLVLEDLHWADTSTLDLVVFLAHNLVDCQVTRRCMTAHWAGRKRLGQICRAPYDRAHAEL